MRAALMLVVLLPALAWPQESTVKRVTFLSQPAGAQVWVGQKQVGLTGQPIELSRELFDNDPRPGKEYVTPIQRKVVFRLAGRRETEAPSLQWGQIRDGGTWPSKPVRLAPASVSSWLQDNWIFLALGVVLCAALSAWALSVRRRQLQTRQEIHELARAQSLVRADASDPYLGKCLGPWTLLERLGCGGMGVVYRAQGREGQVALKIIRQEQCEDQNIRARFVREIALCGKLNHPNLIKIHMCDEQEGLLYYVMELISGTTLSEKVEPQGLPAHQALGYFIPIVQAVHQIHKAGIVHRDIKPSNVMIDQSGRVVVMDFGLAKSSSSAPLTATGEALGTPEYMAPEQIRGSLDARSDQYALGIICYELLTGRRPFLEVGREVLFKHLGDDIASPRSLRPDLAPELEALVMRMLARDPDRRYDSLEDVLDALRVVR
ncbi:serine/threonine protein kinase [bacterium CPR1]|nr:serine/threonine protein kinase [bacterium CPR1]